MRAEIAHKTEDFVASVLDGVLAAKCEQATAVLSAECHH
jgi:hypothetical protein